MTNLWGLRQAIGICPIMSLSMLIPNIVNNKVGDKIKIRTFNFLYQRPILVVLTKYLKVLFITVWWDYFGQDWNFVHLIPTAKIVIGILAIKYKNDPTMPINSFLKTSFPFSSLFRLHDIYGFGGFMFSRTGCPRSTGLRVWCYRLHSIVRITVKLLGFLHSMDLHLQCLILELYVLNQGCSYESGGIP
jgi:hypothetical protein